jgi:glycosyltransferase involved in cell wall biosynthesis
VLEFCQALARKVQLTLLAPAESHFVAPTDVRHMPIKLPRRGKGIVFEWQLLRALVARFAAPNTLPDVVYVRAGIFQLSALLFARRYRLPCLLEINGDLVAEYPTEYPPSTPLQRLLMALRLKVYRASLRTSYQAADGLIVVTPDLRDMAIQHYGVSPSRVRVIPNGANVLSFLPMQQQVCQRRLNLPTGRRYVGYVGSLTSWQDVPTLIAGFALLAKDYTDTDLLLVGDGASRPQLAAQVQQLGLQQRVHMVGAVPHAQVPLYLNACDITTVPKKTGRTDSPLKVYEAISCGVPVLASAQPGVAFLAEKGCGMLYTPGDAADLARHLDRMLSLPAAELRQMGERARRATEQHYSWDAVVQQVRDFVGEVTL